MMNGKKGSADSLPGPFLDGRKEWSDAFGSRFQWHSLLTVMALGSLVVSGIAVKGASDAAKVNRFIPYTVATDSLGNVKAVAPASEAVKPNEAQIRAQIGQFIEGSRSVYLDAAAERKMIEQAYAALADGSEAQVFVNEYMKVNDPFRRGMTEGVIVDLQSVLNVGGDTWRVEWIETVRGRSGDDAVSVPMQAVVTTVVIPASNETTIFKNPLGIYVKDVSWSQRLK